MNLSKSIFQDCLPIIISFFVGALVLLFVGENPLEIYSLMLSEGFGSTRRIAATLSSATPLIFTAVATAICFRSGVFNIGIEGAFVLGGLAGAFVGFSIEINNSFFHILFCLLAGILVGGFWLYLPSWLRANWKVDEVVTTLMLNFIAVAIATGLVNGPLLAKGAGNNMTPMIHESAELLKLIPPSTLHSGFLIGIFVLILYGYFCSNSLFGFENKMVGLNEIFSKAVGINTKKIIITSMLLSGAIGGLGGSCHALGVLHRFVEGFSPGYGWTGMAIALISRNSALGIFIGSILFGALASAGTTIQLFSDIPLDLVDVLQGTVMLLATITVFNLRKNNAVR